jgi:putative membrane protein
MNAVIALTSAVASTADGAAHWWYLAPFLWVLWAGVIVAIFVLFRSRSRRWHGGDRAKAILAERFARGEISSDEFRERLDALR